MLSEVYQYYKDLYTRSGQPHDMSAEITWASKPVLNQPYKADVNLYIVLRTIHAQKEESENIASNILTLFKSTLNNAKYEFSEIDLTDFSKSLPFSATQRVQAIVKEESIVDLQNQYIPVCYSFDRLPT